MYGINDTTIALFLAHHISFYQFQFLWIFSYATDFQYFFRIESFKLNSQLFYAHHITMDLAMYVGAFEWWMSSRTNVNFSFRPIFDILYLCIFQFFIFKVCLNSFIFHFLSNECNSHWFLTPDPMLWVNPIKVLPLIFSEMSLSKYTAQYILFSSL